MASIDTSFFSGCVVLLLLGNYDYKNISSYYNRLFSCDIIEDDPYVHFVIKGYYTI